MEIIAAPKIPNTANAPREKYPSWKLPDLSRSTPNRKGEITDPKLLSVLNTPKVAPASETPCVDAYGIKEKSDAKYKFAPNPIPSRQSAARISEFVSANKTVKGMSNAMESAIVFLLPNRRSLVPPKNEPTIVVSPTRETMAPARE